VNIKQRVENFKEPIEKVARTVAKDFPDVEWEDLSQELYCIIIEHTDIPEPEDGDPYPTLFGAAKIIARKIRAQHLDISPQYTYRQSDVRRILESSMYYDLWQSGWTPEDDPSEYSHSDAIITRMDVTWAITLLSVDYRDAILSRYRDGVVPQHATPEYKRLDRALRKLTDTINNYKRPHPEGPGSRKAISNAHAQYITDTQWDE